MKSCKKVCLAGNCTAQVTEYVNFSRYHAVCRAHLSLVNQSDTTIHCKNCKNEIQCVKGLTIRNKAEYKNSLKVKTTALSPPLQEPSSNKTKHSRSLTGHIGGKCSGNKCNARLVTKVCNDHMLCQKHFLKVNYCSMCKCTVCYKKYGVNIKPCGAKICEDCIKKNDCCFKCCNVKHDNIPFKECGHYMCREDFSKFKCCWCKVCEICKNFQSTQRDCLHLICKNCEFYNKCPTCCTGTCESCGKESPVLKFKCQIHSFCEDCCSRMDKCKLCPSVCFRCKQDEPSGLVRCYSHPLCNSCSQEFNRGTCVYCKKVEDYTCQICLKTFENFQDTGCEHKICSKCSNFKDNHYECNICIKNYDFCVKCHPSYYCWGCKKSSKTEEVSCSHGLCASCGLAYKDDHYFCNSCDTDQYMNDGNCLKCIGSFCGVCQKIEKLPNVKCGHKICTECFEKDSICPLCLVDCYCSYCNESKKVLLQPCGTHYSCQLCFGLINTENCIFCEKNDSNFRCSFCMLYYNYVEKLDCVHAACTACLTLYKDKCSLCVECSICRKYSPKASLLCNHLVCKDCQEQSIDYNSCVICSSTFIECKVCASYVKSKKCEYNHTICSECSEITLEKYNFSCYECKSFCFYCHSQNGIILLECRHLVCGGCYESIVKRSFSCLICDKDNFHTCIDCNKVLLDEDLLQFSCGHKLCKSCPYKKLCKICNPRHFCIGCNKFNEDQWIACSHSFCEECGIKNKDSDYYCQLCDNTEHFIKGNCELCQQVFQGYCTKCTFPEKVGCKHSICYNCNTNIKICRFCNPRHFCIDCKKLNEYQEITCSHLVCQECGIKNKDPDYYCVTCDSNNHFIKGNCELCKNIIPGYCKKCVFPEKFKCPHSICESCTTNTKICRLCFPEMKCSYCKLKSINYLDDCEDHIICHRCKTNINIDECIKCLKLDSKYQCRFCLMYFQGLKTVDCGCLSCNKCITEGKALCKISTKCEICCEQSHPVINNYCSHTFCEKCYEFYNTSCPICESIVVVCERCNKYKKSKKCNKNQHLICIECSDMYQSVCGFECILCENRCTFCLENKKVYYKECNHVICMNCFYDFEYLNLKCLKCEGHDKNTCIECTRTIKSEKIKVCCCGHILCFDCCPDDRCNHCEYLECSNCKIEFIKETLEKSQEISEKFNLEESSWLACQHVLCFECRKITCEICKKLSCKVCISEANQEKKCNHIICIDCNRSAKDSPSQCLKCAPCSFCKLDSCKRVVMDSCRHVNCSFLKLRNECFTCTPYSCYCIKCLKRKDETCIHGLCDTCINCEKHEECTINHCNSCYNKTFITRSKVCNHQYCKNCLQLGKCTIKCSNCQRIESIGLKSCKHDFCENCINQCKNCYCLQCESIKEITKSLCEHQICKDCEMKSCNFCLKLPQLNDHEKKEDGIDYINIINSLEQNFSNEVKNNTEEMQYTYIDKSINSNDNKNIIDNVQIIKEKTIGTLNEEVKFRNYNIEYQMCSKEVHDENNIINGKCFECQGENMQIIGNQMIIKKVDETLYEEAKISNEVLKCQICFKDSHDGINFNDGKCFECQGENMQIIENQKIIETVDETLYEEAKISNEVLKCQICFKESQDGINFDNGKCFDCQNEDNELDNTQNDLSNHKCIICGETFCLMCLTDKFPHKKCDHIICIKCNRKAISTQSQCIRCKICEICGGNNCCKEIFKRCNHPKCEKIKNNTCFICHKYLMCYNCFNHSSSLCGHKFCSACSKKKNCCKLKNCDYCKSFAYLGISEKCDHSYCRSCLNQKKCLVKCSKCKNNHSKKFCSHGFCQTCCKYCPECYCQQCTKRHILEVNATCEHYICDKCSKSGCVYCESDKCSHIKIIDYGKEYREKVKKNKNSLLKMREMNKSSMEILKSLEIKMNQNLEIIDQELSSYDNIYQIDKKFDDQDELDNKILRSQLVMIEANLINEIINDQLKLISFKYEDSEGRS